MFYVLKEFILGMNNVTAEMLFASQKTFCYFLL
ncbi:Uncharacterised protein [Sphingobacterium mizutaii]|uniref:Uncharacterized protein n=1 Tax=Sphingobacterium mizutaii TaxID=1010 RepID=A0AAJ4XAJ2_9SPHI|nr:hypothetical protein SAMN05192578_101546 [Sphingobacterium mizutaii]SNV48995.1 Uncharacterised protein [Sphingobacterium mizutaii]